MADQEATPLTDEERAELEALRAEKAAREEAERARKERAELEALRAESQAAQEPKKASASPAQAPAADHEPRTFGQRMVMTPETDDPDDIPGMPPAQKIIIAVLLVVVIAGGAWIALSNAGIV